MSPTLNYIKNNILLNHPVLAGRFLVNKNFCYNNYMECRKEQNLQNCNCTYPGCSRKGSCCECLKYHRDSDELPACYFSTSAEKTYDRSIDAFIADLKE